MLTDTTIIDNGGSVYVRIPALMVTHFKIQDRPLKCKIEDLNDTEAKLVFG